MSQDRKLVVICGLARSGTTYVGRAISRARGVHLIHEPLNKDFGIKGVPQWYPYVEADDQENSIYIKELIRDIISFRGGWTKSSPQEYPFITRSSKRLYGGRSGIVWSMLRMKKFIGLSSQTTCLKDPFATFAIDHLVKSYGAKVVCMTKHPCALYISQKRRGRESHIEDLFAQHKLRDKYAGDISSGTWEVAKNRKSAGIALLWKIMARVITSQARDLKDLLIVRHEDLCLDPLETINSVCAHFGIARGRRVERYVQKTSQRSRVYAKIGKLHSFKRNSLTLKDAWRGVIDSRDEKLIQEVIGDDIHLIYEHW